MARKQENIGILECDEKVSSLINCIHQFSHKLIRIKDEKEIYQLLIECVFNQIGLIEYIMYKVNPQTKELKNIAACGKSKLNGIKVVEEDELIRAQIGLSTLRGNILTVASSGSFIDNFNIVSIGSEIIVPIASKGIVFAIIIGKLSVSNTLTDSHRKLWEVVTSLAADTLIKLKESDELKEIKSKLESVLEKKDDDLTKIIDILSSQNSELKYYNEKQKELLQELHHRVTNNLQTISSIIRLYEYGNQKDSLKALREIYNRVQILAIIYQHIYKSMENDYVEVESFLQDLVSYLKSTSDKTKVDFHIKSDIRCLNFNILISIGLFIAEIFYSWLKKTEDSGTAQIKFKISMKGSNVSSSLIVTIKDEDKIVLDNLINIQSSENINDIMISGLVDQLDGQISQGFENGNYINLQFKP